MKRYELYDTYEAETIPDELICTSNDAESSKHMSEKYELMIAMETLQNLAKAIKEVGWIITNITGGYVDALLYNANDRPKWWHLYEHAKKVRIRKKYRNRLEKHLYSKLLAAADEQEVNP